MERNPTERRDSGVFAGLDDEDLELIGLLSSSIAEGEDEGEEGEES